MTERRKMELLLCVSFVRVSWVNYMLVLLVGTAHHQYIQINNIIKI